MARLIDADKRIAEIKKIYCDGCDDYGGTKCRDCWVDDAMCLIDDAPTVEVVRCKDCKHSECYGTLLYCGHERGLAGSVAPNNFCSYGEQKDGDGNG